MKQLISWLYYKYVLGLPPEIIEGMQLEVRVFPKRPIHDSPDNIKYVDPMSFAIIEHRVKRPTLH